MTPSTTSILKFVVATLFGSLPLSMSAVGAERLMPNRNADPVRPPNVMIILCDDLGFSDVGEYGSEIQTPNLDRLAKQGRRFTQFYNTARCWPTRAALLTGYYAQQVRRDAVPGVKSGGVGQRPAWAKLLPQRLQALGYRCYHSGKWHVDRLPTQQGFDHSYSLQDHDRHFQPRSHTLDDRELHAVTDGAAYYSSTAIAQYAIDHLEEHFQNHPDRPFFSYVAFTAPHFPLHAPQDLIAHYRERYRAGWDELRSQRWERMKKDFPNATLPAIERELGPPYAFPTALDALGPGESPLPKAWNELSELQRAFQTDKMAIHAAMVHAMDIEIGRIVDTLRDHQQLDSTCLIFLSDNGASAEIMVRGDGHQADAPPGSAATFLCLGPGWSSHSNTPFRKHKTWVHEGGITTPCIVHWPERVSPRSKPIDAPAHVIDLVPTILEIIPDAQRQQPALPDAPTLPGQSLASLLVDSPDDPNGALTDQTRALTERTLWWQHEGNRALRQGPYKIVAAGHDAAWELYDLIADRTETRDLSAVYPDRLQNMAREWERLRDAFIADAKRDLPESR